MYDPNLEIYLIARFENRDVLCCTSQKISTLLGGRGSRHGEFAPESSFEIIGIIDEKHGVGNITFIEKLMRNSHAVGIVYVGNSRE